VAFLEVWIRSVRVILTATCLILLPLMVGNRAHGQTAHFVGAQVTLPIGTLTNPWGMAVDTSGNVYVADNATNSLSKLTPSGALTLDFLTGDGSPYGVAVDAAGNLYITDKLKNEVVKETLQQPGGYYKKSVLPLSGLNQPKGIAVDGHGNVYVADSQNNRVVKATPFKNSYTQSIVPGSALSHPDGVAVDGSGSLYIADTHHFRVVKNTPSGSNWSESTVANLENYDAPPIGIAADVAGDVFILIYQDDENYSVAEATLSGGAYTLRTLPSVGETPYGIAADAAGDAYIVSSGSNRLLEELAGPATNFGALKVASPSAVITLTFSFDTPGALGGATVWTQGNTGMDFTDAGTGTCESQTGILVYNPGDTCTVDAVFKPQVSGARYGAVELENPYFNKVVATGYVFGTGVGPQITFPPGTLVSVSGKLENPSGMRDDFSGLAVDALGDVFFAESSGGWIEEAQQGPSYNSPSFPDFFTIGHFDHPSGVALDAGGNFYITTGSAVYKASPADRGYASNPIITDLPDLVAIALDRSANLYLTSSASGDVHKETLQTTGSYIETSIGYGISSPKGVAVDGSGNIFILSGKSNDLYIETLQADRSYLQTTFALGIAEPENLTVDGNGNIYVADTDRGEIVKLTPQPNGSYVENIARSGLNAPTWLAVDGLGNLYYSQSAAGVTMIHVSDEMPEQ
jgi:sugar lactone lactonase YvrE